MGKGEKMRLIDADNLKIPSDAPYKASVKRVVAQQPTVEAVPVVHGEWVFGKNHGEFVEAECSACNGVLLVKWYEKLSEYNYCPNCGADMRTSAK